MACKKISIPRFVASLLLISTLFLSVSCTVKTSRRMIGSPDPIKIQDVRVAEGVDKTIIELESDEPILYTSFRLSDPDRLVIEMADVTFGQYKEQIEVTEGPVRAIHLASSGELDVSRLEFELSGLVKTEVRPEGLNIVIEVTRLEKASGPGKTVQVEARHKNSLVFLDDRPSAAKESKTEMAKSGAGSMAFMKPTQSESPMELRTMSDPSIREEPMISSGNAGAMMAAGDSEMVKTEPVKPSEPLPLVVAKKAVPMQAAKQITGVRFIHGVPLQFVISSDGVLSPQIFFVGKNKKRLVLDFPGVHKTIKTSQIPGDNLFVKRVRLGQHPGKLRMVLDLNQRLTYSWEQRQNELWLILQ